jgi:hypothetical protein
VYFILNDKYVSWILQCSRKEIKTEYKKKFRPFSQYDYVEGKFLKKNDAVHLPDAMPELPQSDSWYREVLELRKKAGEYRVSCLLLATDSIIILLFFHMTVFL